MTRVCAGCAVVVGGRAVWCAGCACGKPSGYERHRRRGEEACDECRAARNAQVQAAPGYRVRWPRRTGQA